MFEKATRSKKKLRMAISGPSGSGKTYTALAIATALAADGKVALIDTEHRSASLYSDHFDFDVCELDDFNPENYIKAIDNAATEGYSVVVIDSLSHAWSGKGGVLDQVNKRGGNSFTDGWGKVGTPLQNRLIESILTAPLHVISTMRVKTEYVVELNASGKSVPRRVGLKEIQREGVEYEMDIVGVMDLSNTLIIEKSRMSDLNGAIIEKPDAKLAVRIETWLNAGAPAVVSNQQKWATFLSEHGFKVADIEAALGTGKVGAWMKEHNATLDTAMSNMVDWALVKKDKQPAGK